MAGRLGLAEQLQQLFPDPSHLTLAQKDQDLSFLDQVELVELVELILAEVELVRCLAVL